MVKKGIISLLIILLGGTFIFSGITKYLSIDIYEISLVEQHLASWSNARFFSRLIIGFEIALGVLLILHYRLKFILKTTIVLLCVFSVLLGLQILFGTELENCFCFGETFQLNNTESIFKNGILLLIAFLALKNEALFEIKKWNSIIISLTVFILSTSTICILYPPISIYEEYNLDTFKDGDDFPVLDSLPQDVYKGDVILAFMSSTCPHCKQAGMKLALEEKKENQKYKIYPVFGFGKKKIKYFMDATEIQSEPIMILKNDFLKLTKGRFPQIYFLKDGKVVEILNKTNFMNKEL